MTERVGKVTLIEGGGFYVNECPNCGGEFSVSLTSLGKICNPVTCVVKNEPHDFKKVQAWVREEELKNEPG